MTGWQGEKTTLWLGAGVGTGPWAQHTRDHSVGLAHGHVCTPYTHPVLLSGRRTRSLCHTHTHTRTHARTHGHRVDLSLLLLCRGWGVRDSYSTKSENSTITTMPVQSRSTCCRERLWGEGQGLRGGTGRGAGGRGPRMAVPVGSSPWVIFLQEVRQHVHPGDVEKAARGEGQDPGHSLLCSRRSPDWLGVQGSHVYYTPSRGVDRGQNLAWTPGSGQLCPLAGAPLLTATTHHARTYSLGGLRTDGEAGAQQAPQGRRELQLGCAPSVKAGPEQDGKVAHLRGGPDDHSGPQWGQIP